MKVFRVILKTEQIAAPGESPIEAVQHVAFVVTPSKAKIPEILMREPGLEKVVDAIPRVMEEYATDVPLWTVKIGPPTTDASLFACIPCASRRGVKAALVELYRPQPMVLEMIANGWYRVNPKPIDVTQAGVW